MPYAIANGDGFLKAYRGTGMGRRMLDAVGMDGHAEGFELDEVDPGCWIVAREGVYPTIRNEGRTLEFSCGGAQVAIGEDGSVLVSGASGGQYPPAEGPGRLAILQRIRGAFERERVFGDKVAAVYAALFPLPTEPRADAAGAPQPATRSSERQPGMA